MKQCPLCENEVDDYEIVCPFCSRSLIDVPPSFEEIVDGEIVSEEILFKEEKRIEGRSTFAKFGFLVTAFGIVTCVLPFFGRQLKLSNQIISESGIDPMSVGGVIIIVGIFFLVVSLTLR